MLFFVSAFLGDDPRARIDVLERLHWWTFLYPFALGLGVIVSVVLRRYRRRIRLVALFSLPAFTLFMMIVKLIEFYR